MIRISLCRAEIISLAKNILIVLIHWFYCLHKILTLQALVAKQVEK